MIKTGKMQWFIWLIILLFGTSGCSYVTDVLKKDRQKIEEKLEEWRKAELKARKILKNAEDKDTATFEDEYYEALSEMHEAHEEFLELIEKTDDKGLKKKAKLCSKGMAKVRMALWTYGSYVQLYLEHRASGNVKLIKDAQNRKDKEFLDYSRSRQQGQNLIEKSGL